MSQYFLFLKNGIIDFDKCLIEKYSFIGLDEIDAMILIKLKKLIDSTDKINEGTIIKELSKTMSINETTLSEKIVNLISSQYISLKVENNKEIYSLDDTYKRIAALMDIENVNEEISNEESDLKKSVSFIEKETSKLITPLELEIIKNWIEVQGYKFEDIKDACLECLKHKKTSVKFIDMQLKKAKTSETKATNLGNSNLEDLFNSVYGKITK